MKLKYTELRRYMKTKKSVSHLLQDCDIVIDADRFFKDTYKRSGCQFILGPECDLYADFLINKLSCFLESNVKCYVVFKGTTEHDLDKVKEIYQKNIANRNNYGQIVENAEYFRTLLVEDIQKQVLEEMGIKYFVCENDFMEAIIGVARKYKCPVLTDKIEYCLFGLSCILPNSLVYEKNTQAIKCTIHDHETHRKAFGVYKKMPMVLTLLNENGEYLENLFNIVETRRYDKILRWFQRRKEEVIVDIILEHFDDENQKADFEEDFKEDLDKIQTFFLYPSCHLAVKYFQRDRPYGLFRDDKKWFAKGVSNGRIPPVYINLKKKGVICGSLLMNDINQPDALLAAMDIIAYSHSLLTNSQESSITFVGRKHIRSMIWEIITHWEKEISNQAIFMKHKTSKKCQSIIIHQDPFQNFLKEKLPEDCWILIITLVYYIFKQNSNFISGAYCVLLSYFILGPVSEKIHDLKKAGLISNEHDCVKLYNGLKFLFNKVVEEKYNSGVVHSFSEFQHCLQHMNYLNKLCGEIIPCTVYHDTYNATFVYNSYLFMKDKNHLMTFLENNFQGNNVLKRYKDLVTGFENCLSAVKSFAEQKSL